MKVTNSSTSLRKGWRMLTLYWHYMDLQGGQRWNSVFSSSQHIARRTVELEKVQESNKNDPCKSFSKTSGLHCVEKRLDWVDQPFLWSMQSISDRPNSLPRLLFNSTYWTCKDIPLLTTGGSTSGLLVPNPELSLVAVMSKKKFRRQRQLQEDPNPFQPSFSSFSCVQLKLQY